MAEDRDLQKKLEELSKEVERLKETSSSRGWGDPHDIARQAMSAIEFYRSYYGTGVGFPERVREIVEIVKTAGVNRASGAAYGASFVFGFGKLLEDAYLGTDLHAEVHGEVNRRRLGVAAEKAPVPPAKFKADRDE